jgi:hypothetical protein
LLQPYSALRNQELERAKLKADTEYTQARPEIDSLKLELEQQKANRKYEIDVLKAENAGQLALARMENMQARLALDYEKLNAAREKADKKDKPSVSEMKMQADLVDRVGAATEATELMADLREEIMANPSAATLAGPWASKLVAGLAGAKAFVREKQGDPDKTIEGTVISERLDQMNISDVKQRSLVVALAYKWARAVDPNGRISDKDLEAAKVVVTGEGGPAARLAVLDQTQEILTRATERSMNMARDYGSENIGINPDHKSYGYWQQSQERYTGLKAPKKDAAPAKKSTPAPAGVEQKFWDAMPDEDKKLWQTN